MYTRRIYAVTFCGSRDGPPPKTSQVDHVRANESYLNLCSFTLSRSACLATTTTVTSTAMTVLLRLFLITLACLSSSSSWAFVVVGVTPTKQHSSVSVKAFESTSFYQAADNTIDPTAVLSNSLGNFLDSPAILAVPIVTALGLASLIAWLIVAYAEPQVQDDD